MPKCKRSTPAKPVPIPLPPRSPMCAQPKPLILVVEDDKDLAQLIADQLEVAGMASQIFYRGAAAVKYLEKSHANLILLDVTLPDQTGFETLKEICRMDRPAPVIFLTANDSETMKVQGLQSGADDYVTKPFRFPELIARIHAVLRRTETAKDTRLTDNAALDTQPFDFSGAIIHPERLEVEFPGKKIEKIGRKELGILLHMTTNAGHVVSRQSLIHAVWGVHADVRSRSLDQYIVKIRDTYEKHGIRLDNFRTIHGIGYCYEPSSAGAVARKNAKD